MEELLEKIEERGLFFKIKDGELILYRDENTIKCKEIIEKNIRKIDNGLKEFNKGVIIKNINVCEGSYYFKLNNCRVVGYKLKIDPPEPILTKIFGEGYAVVSKVRIDLRMIKIKKLRFKIPGMKDHKDCVFGENKKMGKIKVSTKEEKDKNFSIIEIEFSKNINIEKAKYLNEKMGTFLTFYFKKYVEIGYMEAVLDDGASLCIIFIGKDIYKNEELWLMDEDRKSAIFNLDYGLFLRYLNFNKEDIEYTLKLYRLWVKIVKETNSFEARFFILMSIIDRFYNLIAKKDTETIRKRTEEFSEFLNYIDKNKHKTVVKWLKSKLVKDNFINGHIKFSEKIKRIYEYLNHSMPDYKTLESIGMLRNSIAHGLQTDLESIEFNKKKQKPIYEDYVNELENITKSAIKKYIKEL